MKKKEEIKREISELAQKISATTLEDTLLKTVQELYEKSILLKHASNTESEIIIKQEKGKNITAEESIKPVFPPVITEKKQVPIIDLFSSETSPPEIPSSSLPKTPAPVERKETKKQSDLPAPKEHLRIGQVSESVAEKLQHKKITNLKASIGINEKFQFINELFEGNMKEYTVAVDQINNFSTHSEAESYLSNLQEVYKWNPDNQIAENFRELVGRRFS